MLLYYNKLKLNYQHLKIYKVNNLLKNKIVALVGFMGVGKSTLGRRLAKKLDIPFVDSDKEIEIFCNMTIPDIFSKYGEKYFRSIEEKIIINILNVNEGPIILSLGGGAFVNDVIRKGLRNKAISVWLKTDIIDIITRIKRSQIERPLLKKKDFSKAKTLKLYNERKFYYGQANIILDIYKLNKNQVLDLTIEKLYLYLNYEKSNN